MEKRQPRVGFVIYAGTAPSKRTLGGQMLAGFLQADKQLAIRGRIVYVGPTQDPTGTLTLLARQKYDLILVALPRLDVVYNTARKFPHVRFFSLDTALHGPKAPAGERSGQPLPSRGGGLPGGVFGGADGGPPFRQARDQRRWRHSLRRSQPLDCWLQGRREESRPEGVRQGRL